MPSFRYVAITPAGETMRGAMDAVSPQAVVEAIRKQGNIPVRAEPTSGAGGGALSGFLNASLGGGEKLRRQEVANLTRELAIMLGAGQDLDRALRFLVETAPNARAARLLDQIRASVRDGASLATALSKFPASFSRLYIGLVRAGEAGGSLAPTLDRLALLLERQRALAASIGSALVYPAILVVASTGAIVLLLTEVLPQFVPLFAQNGAALPTPTKILIEVGHLVGAYGLYGVMVMLVLGLLVRQALRVPAIRIQVDRWSLRLPVLGRLGREILAARFSRTLGTLVGNGLPLIAALDIVREVIGNLWAQAAVQRATESAKSGAGLSRPLGESGIFPVRTVYLLRLGEETAQLGAMALRAAEIHEENTRLGLQRLVALLVPVIIIVMGAAVAGIIASLMLAMLSLNDLAG